jgi:hypothetical protein
VCVCVCVCVYVYERERDELYEYRLKDCVANSITRFQLINFVLIGQQSKLQMFEAGFLLICNHYRDVGAKTLVITGFYDFTLFTKIHFSKST